MNSLRVSWEKSRSDGAARRAAGVPVPVGSRSYIQGDLQQFVLEAAVLRMSAIKPSPSQYTPYPDYAEFIFRGASIGTGLEKLRKPVCHVSLESRDE